MVETISILLVGLPLGILASFIAWWILFHRIVPQLEFSEQISKTSADDNPSGSRYRLKISNTGRRDMIDIEVLAKFRAKGLRKGYPHNWDVVYLPTRPPRIPVVTRAKEGGVVGYLIRFDLHRIPADSLYNFPATVRNSASMGTISLEDLFLEHTETKLQLFVFGYDHFSGSRKMFQSKTYQSDDVVFGQFEPKGLEIRTGVDGDPESDEEDD